jgi:predicted enzyme related to lactoylglutathione lyase
MGSARRVVIDGEDERISEPYDGGCKLGFRREVTAMVTGGNATVFLTNMNAPIKFYTEVLGLKVTAHYGDAWATVAAGGFVIGLHPAGPKSPAAGTPGSIQIGLMVDDIEVGLAKLKEGGARNIGEIERGDGGSFVHFGDPDGNALYLWQMPKW